MDFGMVLGSDFAESLCADMRSDIGVEARPLARCDGWCYIRPTGNVTKDQDAKAVAYYRGYIRAARTFGGYRG